MGHFLRVLALGCVLGAIALWSTSDGAARGDGPASASASASASGCDALARDWIEERRRAHERRVEARASSASGGRKDFLFFLHVPRTAGRSFHWCFLKPSFDAKDLCGNQYTGVKLNPRDPNCSFLATHDDYSLVERFAAQPRVVTMLRKPSARVLSSYEFAIEVAARSFGQKPSAIEKRVQTREVWPWDVLTPHIDRQLREYDEMIKADASKKISISDVYANELYTSFEEWVEMKIVKDDVHNGQFFQVLGFSNNTDATMEPRAAELRACALQRGSTASTLLMEYAKERLEREIDVLALHERLDESIALAAKQLRMPLSSGAHFVDPATVDAQNLKSRLAKGIKARSARGESVDIVGFVFRFSKLRSSQLSKEDFRESYTNVLREGVSTMCGVHKERVHIWPLDSASEDWKKNSDGFHIMTVAFTARDGGDAVTMAESYDAAPDTPESLYAALVSGDAKFFQTVIAPNVKIDASSYGEFELSAYGRASDRMDANTVVAHPLRRTVSEQYRVCEAGQFEKYGRLRSNALKHITERIHGTYETFSARGRKRISRRLISRVDELNFLDYELWAFARELFERRLATSAPLERLPAAQKTHEAPISEQESVRDS